jgi:hypothetical protein
MSNLPTYVLHMGNGRVLPGYGAIPETIPGYLHTLVRAVPFADGANVSIFDIVCRHGDYWLVKAEVES